LTISPSVSVIIPARDAAPTLERTLRALGDQRLDEAFEVIVIDDGSADNTAQVAERHAPRVRLIRNERSEGPGAARNRGVAAARGSVLAFTDSDCFPTPQWLARGLEAIADVDLVQGAVAPDPAVARTPFDRTVTVTDDGGFYETANMFVRHDVFDATGGFTDWVLERRAPRPGAVDRRRGRAARTPIGEDTLFGWTARRHGARSRFAPEALVHHAVVPGGPRDEIADRWHWGRDMPGLARLVPELRSSTFYRRWFFHRKTARLDLALAGLAVAVLTRRWLCLLAVVPYADWVGRESARWGREHAAGFVAGSLAVDVATFGALVTGSVSWRSLLL